MALPLVSNVTVEPLPGSTHSAARSRLVDRKDEITGKSNFNHSSKASPLKLWHSTSTTSPPTVVPSPTAQPSRKPWRAPACRRTPSDLCWNTLGNFEVVTDQFLAQGVRFENAIAIDPSNPAFRSSPDATRPRMVLMGAPRAGFLSATFERPIHQVEACITSSRPLVMTAIDQHNQVLAQTETLTSNLVDHAPSHLPPDTCLGLKVGQPTIHRVLFQCTGGQFILSRLSFTV